MDTRFTGVIPPVVTPFTVQGEIDLESLDRLIDVLIEGGVTGLFSMGSTSEVAYLTDAQRDVVVGRTVERVAGRVPVLVGAIDTTAGRVVEQARRAAALGADAIVSTCPFYALNSEAEYAAHFRAWPRAWTCPCSPTTSPCAWAARSSPATSWWAWEARASWPASRTPPVTTSPSAAWSWPTRTPATPWRS